MNRPHNLHENFDREELPAAASDRSFCLMFTVCFALLGVCQWYRGYGHPVLWLVFSAVLLIVALIKPSLAATPNRMWMQFGVLLTKITNPFFLGLVYYIVLTPFGLCMRLTGKDLLRLRYDSGTISYWIVRLPSGTAPEAMENQF